MRIWLVALLYSLAFLAGLATLWAFVALGVMQLLEGQIDSVFVMLMIPVIAALAVFSVVYGLASGTALKWRFWLFAPLAMAALVWVALQLVMAGFVDVFGGFAGAVLLTYVAGFLVCLQRDAVTALPEAET